MAGHGRGRVREGNHRGGRAGGGAQPPLSRGAPSGHQHRRPLHVRRVEQEEQHACAVWGSLRSTWIILKIINLYKIKYTFKHTSLSFQINIFFFYSTNLLCNTDI